MIKEIIDFVVCSTTPKNLKIASDESLTDSIKRLEPALRVAGINRKKRIIKKLADINSEIERRKVYVSDS